MVQSSATSSYEKPTKDGTRTAYREQLAPATIKDVPRGMTHQLGPLGTLRSPIYIEVDQFLLRKIWSRWNAPEYMSGDASNANYSSTLVAESPFVKAREADQRFYSVHYERLAWKALYIYHELGAFGRVTWEQIRQSVRIKIDVPEVASRDPLAQAQWNELLHRNRIKSKRTWAAELGLDLDEELREMQSEPQVEPQAASPFGESVVFEQDCGTGAGGFKGGNTCATGERGASAVFKGEKFRTVSKRARLNVDQMTDLMGERGYEVGKPEYSAKLGATVYPITKDSRKLLVPAKTIHKFLTTEFGDIDDILESVDPARTEQLAQWAIRSLVEGAAR
jgi:hypothetical protein